MTGSLKLFAWILILWLAASCATVADTPGVLSTLSLPTRVAPGSQAATPTPSLSPAANQEPTPGPDKPESPEAGNTQPSPPSQEVSPTPIAPAIPSFAFWNVQSLQRIFQADNLKFKETRPLSSEEINGLPSGAAQSAWLDLQPLCYGCWARIFTFDSPEALQEMMQALEAQNAGASQGPTWLLADRNALLQISGNANRKLAEAFQTALETLLPASLLRPTDFGVEAYESWDEYYPLDRGQQVDPARGMGQRTYNRWNDDNFWQYGQASWRYQAPDGSQAPPPFMPAGYNGEGLTYFYLYPCEQSTHANPAKDCLNWQMFIELAAITNQNTEFQNWADGGWRWKERKLIDWEVYYPPGSFSGQCTKSAIRSQVSDEFLQDPAAKMPLTVRLPKTIGLVHVSPLYCSVHFRSYLLRARDVRDAFLGLITTESLEKTYLAEEDHFLIKAVNRFYKFRTVVDGEAIFEQYIYEMYWMRTVDPDNQLRYGYDAYWWHTWGLPPEEHWDNDDDPNWSEFQWCRQDLSKDPPGLGRLVCEEP
jgi:hypothetical protein